MLHSMLALWVSGVLMAGLSAQARAESATAESDALHSGQLVLRDTAQVQAAYRPALMQGSKVHLDISGLVATVRLSQTFRNTSQQFVEGVYGFPLPDEAAVRYMEMTVGERRIVGKVRERAAALAQYTEAKNAGKKAGLVEQQRPNLFTSRLANIAPGDIVSVTLEYVQPVSFDAGVFSLRLPTTITPRYMPGLPLVPGEEPAEAEALTLNAYHGWAMPTGAV
ncbi:MAG: marine proteobacterial sortase target protein, partial [Halioglobus sp.]|nr:marine proteobacterial sortase target protein [Halioglobus sp.]